MSLLRKLIHTLPVRMRALCLAFVVLGVLPGVGIAGVSQARPAQVTTAPAKQTFRVPMRDGVRLTTDVYLPAGKGPFPIILLRTPYDKNGGKVR